MTQEKEIKETHLETEVRCSLTNQSEGSADVDLQDDVKCIVGRSVQHLVKGKSSIVHNVVDLAKLPT